MTTQQVKDEPLVKEIIVNAPAAKVWKALTDKAQMKEWYFDMSDFKPEVGFEFSFVGKDEQCVEYVHLCKITEVIPNKKLVHSWEYKGYEGKSYVTWELFEEGANTTVKLTHTGISTFGDIPAFGRKNFDAGWTSILGTSLKNYVEK